MFKLPFSPSWFFAYLMTNMKVVIFIYRWFAVSFSGTTICLVVITMEGRITSDMGLKVWLFADCSRGVEKFCFWKRAEMENGVLFETFWSIWKHAWLPIGEGELACCSARLGQTASDFSRLADFFPTSWFSPDFFTEVGSTPPPLPPLRTLLG